MYSFYQESLDAGCVLPYFQPLTSKWKTGFLTSDKAPVDMQDIEQRLLSRFKWGLSAELQKT